MLFLPTGKITEEKGKEDVKRAEKRNESGRTEEREEEQETDNKSGGYHEKKFA